MTEKPTDDRDDAEDPAGSSGDSGEPPVLGESGKPESKARRRIPESDPASHETKRYIVADSAPLAVTIRNGGVAREYAPAVLITKLTERINALLVDLGGGFQPMFYGAAPGNSMVLYFGDPHPEGAQGQLPVEIVGAQAQRVAALLELEGDALFSNALELGASGAQRYNELTQTIHAEGVTVSWKVRDQKERTLPPDRAERQHTLLSRPGKLEDRFLTVNGVLYRVIAEPRDEHLGTVGIRLHKWSARPPGVSKGGKVFPAYVDERVENAIKQGLINEPVQAKLRLQHAVFGTSIRPGLQAIFLDEIEGGPREDSIYGESMFDNEDGDEE
jgi:hypothetical protein